MIAGNSSLIVVDVREQDDEYCDNSTGHIPGSLNYPWLTGVLQERYDELPIDADILVVCRSGGRSAAASDFLCLEGYTNVFNMTGGMLAWEWDVYTGCCFSVADCDDTLFCTGQETCVNLNCRQGAEQCTQAYFMCDEDNDICVECPGDCDCDGVPDGDDNCFIPSAVRDTANGPNLGTCV